VKQTAVQWLFLMLNNPNRDQEFANKLLEKALEMEKEQIEKIFVDVTKATLQNLGIESTLQDIIDFKKIAEVYYNEEFKNTNL